MQKWLSLGGARSGAVWLYKAQEHVHFMSTPPLTTVKVSVVS